MQLMRYTPGRGQWTSIRLQDSVCLRERVGGECDYEAARLAMAGGLLQSVRCALWMVQQADGAGD